MLAFGLKINASTLFFICLLVSFLCIVRKDASKCTESIWALISDSFVVLKRLTIIVEYLVDRVSMSRPMLSKDLE